MCSRYEIRTEADRPEEAAFRSGFLSLPQLDELVAKIPKCEYRDYLAEVVAEAKRLQK